MDKTYQRLISALEDASQYIMNLDDLGRKTDIGVLQEMMEYYSAEWQDYDEFAHVDFESKQLRDKIGRDNIK